jgi:hypothetical protein
LNRHETRCNARIGERELRDVRERGGVAGPHAVAEIDDVVPADGSGGVIVLPRHGGLLEFLTASGAVRLESRYDDFG